MFQHGANPRGMNEPLFTQKRGRKSNGFLSLKSEQKPIKSHKVVQHDKSNPKRFFKNMCNFLKIWQQVKERKNKFFFPSIYMKMN